MSGAKVRNLFRALKRHDRLTAQHSARVRRYVLWLAAEFGLAPAQRRQLSLAAALHDIGKICMPLVLLNKPDRLTPEEYRLLQTHPVYGEWILRSVLPDAEALTTVRWHHERPDGRGYPDGLEGWCIPLPARILAVADGYDAMTTTRPYRQALGAAQALDTLLMGAGSQFDADVVECFARILRKAWISMSHASHFAEIGSPAPAR